MSAELTYQDIAAHNTKKDIYLVIHDKVYNASKFIDEHPGGEEVMLDVAGQDATEAFEDVGHSDEARETLAQLQIAVLKRKPGDPVPKIPGVNSTAIPRNENSGGGMGIGLYAALLVGGLLAYGAYLYTQQSQSKA